jgi:hypothetical protein
MEQLDDGIAQHYGITNLDFACMIRIGNFENN